MIKNVQKYVDFLFEELHLTNEVLGVLLYGSYVLNEEDEFSDLDILIIVEENNKNICGRGNIIKDSIPIEYFIKTENDIYKELIDELENLEPAMRIELLTGTIIYEKYNTIIKLIKRAKELNLMPYKPLSNIEIEGITITLRNQLNEINRKNKFKEPDLCFCYYNYLYELIKAYCDYEKVPIRKYKFYKTYTNDDYRIKNMQLEIKDEYVKSESIYLISNFDVNKLNDLTKYILNKISNLPNEYRIYRNKDFYYD
jgi:Nucleotidyltransferase domain.